MRALRRAVMPIVQLINSLEKYSADVLCLGFLVCGITSIIKRVFTPNMKKYVTFLPFLAGIVVYAGYTYIVEKSINFCDAKLFEKGFKCGIMATIYYVIFEQFIRGKRIPSALSALQLLISGQIEGVVIEAYVTEIAKVIEFEFEKSYLDEAYIKDFIVKTLKPKALAGISENHLARIADIIYRAARLHIEVIGTKSA